MNVTNMQYTAQSAESGDRSEGRSATAAAKLPNVSNPEVQTLTDALVTAIRDAHEQRGIGYRTLARMFGVKRSTVQKYCLYERRATAHYCGVGIAAQS